MDNKKEVRFIVEGNEKAVREFVDEFKAVVLEEYGHKSESKKDESYKSDDAKKWVDPNLVISVVIGLPGAIVGAMTIYDRIKKKKKLEKTMKKTGQIIRNKKECKVRTEYPDGRIVEFSKTDVVEILDQFVESED